MKNKFIVLVGPPAIGKSTYTKNTLASLRPTIISRDDIVEQVSNESGITYNEYYAKLADPELANLREKVEHIVQNKFKDAINNNENIVVDMTHMNKNSRKRTLKYIASADYEKVAVVFKFEKQMIPYLQKLSLGRTKEYQQVGKIKYIPDHVFYEMADRFEPVDNGEGFDTIVHIDDSDRIYGA
jgi:predicted kinase